MQNNFKYINLSWAVVGICENPHQPLLVHIPGIDEDEAAAVEHYVIGYMASGTSPLWMRTASCPVTTMPCATMPAAR